MYEMNKQEKMKWLTNRIKSVTEQYGNNLSEEIKQDFANILPELEKGNDNSIYKKRSINMRAEHAFIHAWPGATKESYPSKFAFYQDAKMNYEQLLTLIETGQVFHAGKGTESAKMTLESIIQTGREKLNDKTIEYGNRIMPKVPVLSEVFSGFPKSFKENHKGYEVMAESPYGLGNLLTSRINCTNIGAVTGAASPLIGWYALLSDFGKMPIVGAIMAPVAYLMSFPLSLPLSIVGLFSGIYYGHQLDNYLKSRFYKKENR